MLSVLLILTFTMTGAPGIDAQARQPIRHEDIYFHFLPSSPLPSSCSSLKWKTSLASPAARGMVLLCMRRVDQGDPGEPRPGRLIRTLAGAPPAQTASSQAVRELLVKGRACAHASVG